MEAFSLRPQGESLMFGSAGEAVVAAHQGVSPIHTSLIWSVQPIIGRSVTHSHRGGKQHQPTQKNDALRETSNDTDEKTDEE